MGMIHEPSFITDINNEEILLSLKTLCSVYAGSCPLDRDFGIDAEIIDNDIEIAKTMFMQDILDKIEKYIPEIIVTELEFLEKEDMQGLWPVIYFTRKDEDEISI